VFLTKIELDPSRRQARRYLGSPQVMHAVVLKAAGATASSGPGRVLWRVDEASSTMSLYLLTPSRPDCSQFLDEAARIGAQARTLDYEPFLSKLTEHQVWAFRLAANPSRAISQGIGVRGKRQGHVTVEQQRQWLLSRAAAHGFRMLPVNGAAESVGSSLTVVRRARPVFGRSNPEQGRRDRVTINRTVFEGLLQVTDPDLLRTALISGIGRSKAYGCGLMTLAKVR
jgi:CRISPR system Cascade subunit CasE